MSDDDATDWTDYDSGPFCVHWSDPSDCDTPCATCGHECREHYGGTTCHVDGCECEEIKKETDT